MQLAFVGSQQGVAAAQVVVEEGEGFVFGKRDEPEGEFRHFDGHGVFVDSVEAAFTDQTTGNGEPLFTVNG